MKLHVILSFALVAAVANAVRLGMVPPKGPEGKFQSLKAASSNVGGRGESSRGWDTVYSEDLAVFVANLTNTGFSERKVRALVSAEIDRRFRSREESLRPAKRTKYWESELVPEPLETRLARIDLRREKARLRQALLGPDPEQPDDSMPVATEKREQVRMITEDYGALLADTRGRAGASALSGEKKEIEFLESERRRELAALLSPDELTKFDLILSGAVFDLRRDLRYFTPTEDELLVIGTAAKERRQTTSSGPRVFSPDQRAAEDEAQTKRETAIRTAMGEPRYAEYLKSKDPDYRLARDLSARAGISSEAAQQVYDLRAAILNQAVQIGDNAALDSAGKLDALKQLAESARMQSRTILGPDVSVAFVRQIDTSWLRYLEQGSLPAFRENGISISRSLLRPVVPGSP